MDYKKAGVDIEAGYKSVELMKKHIAKTMRPEVLGGIGGFSGAFSMNAFKNMEEPTLVSGTDGCGTKVKLAMIMDKHDTIGIDAVAMCVNDIACAGAEPLFFLDYIACGKNYKDETLYALAEGNEVRVGDMFIVKPKLGMVKHKDKNGWLLVTLSVSSLHWLLPVLWLSRMV